MRLTELPEQEGDLRTGQRLLKAQRFVIRRLGFHIPHPASIARIVLKLTRVGETWLRKLRTCCGLLLLRRHTRRPAGRKAEPGVDLRASEEEPCLSGQITPWLP